MPKNYLEDIKPPRSGAGREMRPEIVRPRTEPVRRAPTIERERPSFDHEDYDTPRRPRFFMWMIAIGSVLALVVALSYLWVGATITVHPLTEQATLNETFVATKDAAGDTGLPFQLMILKSDETQKVPSSGLHAVSIAATGKATLYNSFGPEVQHLKEDTRLETDAGKIYKINGAIDIPGTTTKDGKTVPGELEVSIYAAEPGAEYNLTAPTDLHIFGFKGTPKYLKFIAKTKGTISGGFVGEKAIPDETALATARQTLEKNLETTLNSQALAQIPAGFIFYKDAGFITYDEVVAGSPDETGAVPMVLKGTFYGFIFDRKKLEQKIAEHAVSAYDGAPVTVQNISDLTFALKNKDKLIPQEAKEISFTLSGPLSVVWQIDQEKIKEAVAGKTKNEFLKILAEFTTVESAEISIRPLWKRKIPTALTDITVIVVNPVGKTD